MEDLENEGNGGSLGGVLFDYQDLVDSKEKDRSQPEGLERRQRVNVKG